MAVVVIKSQRDIFFVLLVCFRALDRGKGREMRRLSLRPGEAAVLAHALALWAVDACVYTVQEVCMIRETKGREVKRKFCA